ncbi:MAG: polyphosphate polymerase domain-containing protein [Myxococcota bacterium]
MAKQATDSGYRYERKFVVAGREPSDLENLVRLAPGCFREIHRARHVNNIYLDTRTMDFFSANVMGLSERLKARVRWYGELLGPIARPTLEVKIRSSSVGKKKSFLLDPFSLEIGTSTREIENALKPLPPGAHLLVSTLRPVLLNRYQRKYYLSADGHFRITLDRDLVYRGIDVLTNRFMRREVQVGEIVLELKYDTEYAERADAITQFFNFRMTKSSKYINGIKRVDIRYAGVRV